MTSADAHGSWGSPGSTRTHSGRPVVTACQSERYGQPAAGGGLELLWIDDEVRSDDPLVLLLAQERISTEVAHTGRDGIRAATRRGFDAILLDLRLPDLCGTATLAALIDAGVRAPVVVLTGYGDVPACRAALKLGAADFKEKPISDGELIPLLYSLVRRVQDLPAASRGVPQGPQGMLRPCLERDAIAGLAVLLSDPDTKPDEFFAFTTAFRRALSHHGRRPLGPDKNVGGAARFPSAVNVDRVSAIVEAALRSGRLPQRRELAPLLGRHGIASLLDLQRRTALSYPTLRAALRLRSTLAELVRGEEQISQIAYSVGYDHPAQYARDFRRVFGLCPRDFRQLVRHARPV